MPEGSRIRLLVKAEDFFHAAVAVRRNDQVLARQPRLAVLHRILHESIVTSSGARVGCIVWLQSVAEEVQQMPGHASVTTTELYGKLMKSTLMRAAKETGTIAVPGRSIA